MITHGRIARAHTHTLGVVVVGDEAGVGGRCCTPSVRQMRTALSSMLALITSGCVQMDCPFNLLAPITSGCAQMDCPFSTLALTTSVRQIWTVLQHVRPDHLGVVLQWPRCWTAGRTRNSRRCTTWCGPSPPHTLGYECVTHTQHAHTHTHS